jgi:flagellin
MLSIQTNVNSMNAQENLRLTNNFQGRTISRLTSGFRINESGDDAAGLAIANKYRSDVTELMQGVRNANDGLSTLQIVDGGLSNISKMLDRLKTLATQSASVTFTGNRATLNQEYQSLLGEIDRQAANIGLSDVAGGNGNNKKIAVYVGGGGSLDANSKVQIDLSSASDRVNRTGLGLGGTQINGSAPAALSNAVDLITNKEGHLASSGRQEVTVRTAAATVTATLTGTAAGLTSDELITQLNSQIASTGVSAYIDSTDGQAKFTSANIAFTVSVANDSGAVANKGLTDGAGTAEVASMYKFAGDGAMEIVVDGTTDGQLLTINVDGADRTVVLAENTAANNGTGAASQVNAALNQYGIYAVASASGTDFSLYSTKAFKVTSEAMTTGWGAAAGFGPTDATAPSSSVVSPEVSAQDAIKAISSAVTKLGTVQGKVGTGQNQLQYAIQLAQSQITSFSAAESRIRDADVAQEAANLTKAQVLQQASLAALAQANSAPQAVLSLLRG